MIEQEADRVVIDRSATEMTENFALTVSHLLFRLVDPKRRGGFLQSSSRRNQLGWESKDRFCNSKNY